MSQPPYPYNRIFDFESFSIVNPTTQQPGVQIEGELDNVKRTLDSTISRLSEIQRDDGFLRDSALDHTTVVSQLFNRLATLFSPTFAQIDQNINLKSPIASPTFTGVVTIPANAVIVGFAKLESPAFTGVPTAPTPATLSASQQVANAAFVTAADAAVKQFVIDNYLKLAGAEMVDNAVINWATEIPATQYPAFYRNKITNDISKDGVSLFGQYPHPFSAPLYSTTNRRETIVSQGFIELSEFKTPGVYPVGTPDTDAIWTLKGQIVIWSGDTYDQFTLPSPGINPVSGPHISFYDSYSATQNLNPMYISSNGLKFPDGTSQNTRGLNIGEVQSEANSAASAAVLSLINGSPATLDTLKEIADALGNDANLAGTLTAAIAGKANTVHTHATSDIVGLDTAINSGKIKQYDNFVTYTVGDLVLESNRLFRFNASIGAAGYGPITHPYAWTEQSAAPSLAGYATESFVTSRGYITSSALSGYATQSWVTSSQSDFATESWVYSQGFIQQPALSGYKDYFNGSAEGTTTFSALNGWTGQMEDVLVSAQNAIATWDGWTVVFQIASGRFLNEFDLTTGKQIIVYLGDGSTTLQSWGANVIPIDGSGSGVTIIIPNPSPYISVSVLNGITIPLSLPLVTGSSVLYKEGTKSAFVEDLDSLISNEDYYYKTIVAVTKNQLAAVRVATFTELSSVSNSLSALQGLQGGKANLSGATFTGKVNTTVTATTAPINIGSQPTAPTTTVAGDLWIGASINYKSWDGVQKAAANTNTTNTFTQGQAISVNSVSNAFRINQQGTGPALVVEDSVSPDATPFVIDANGKVGVGVAPDATAAIKVDANGISFNGLVFNPTATAAHTGGSDTLDLLVTINGTPYRLGLRPA